MYIGYRAGALAAQALPGRAVPAVSRAVGRLAARRMADRRAIVERNLRRVLGERASADEISRLAEGAFGSYSRYWIESFRLPGTSRADLDAGMSTENLGAITDGLAEGRGAILALPHLGGWEWAAFWLSEVHGAKITAVAERLEPPRLAEWFVALRRQFGIQVVPLGPSAGSACARALKQNHILALLCDRDIGGGGVPVDFFGERTTLPGGPALLALRSGAPLVPAAVYHEGGTHVGVALPPLPTERQGTLRADVARLTQQLAGRLEVLIRRAPDQWHLMQPNWPSDRAPSA